MSIINKIISESDLMSSFTAHEQAKKARPSQLIHPTEDENHLLYAHKYLIDKGFKPESRKQSFGAHVYTYSHPESNHKVEITAGLASADERINQLKVTHPSGQQWKSSDKIMTHLKGHFGE